MFYCTLLYVHSSIAIILMGKRGLVALLNLSSWCLVMVERLFLMVPQGCLQFVIVVFPDHTHLLFLYTRGNSGYFWYGRRPSSDCKNLHLRVSVDTPINSLWTSFKTKSLSSISKHVPSKMTSSRYRQSWCNRTVRRLSRRKHRAFRKARQNSNRKNWT